MRALAIALGLLAAPAAAADQQFDLVCKGRQQVRTGGKWRPYQAQYRVDLDAKIFCRDECTEARPIASVNAARIEFQKSDTATPSVTVIHYVDRTTGAWISYLSGGLGLLDNSQGVCEKAPFSGFPARKF